MAESALGVDYTVLRRELARFMGWNRAPASWTVNQATDGDDIIDAALRDVYGAHRWSFLYPLTFLDTVAAYSTGTVTIASGVVTLADGTWPSWAAVGEIVVDGLTYTVDTRDSDSQITLDDTTVTATAGSSYTLVHPYYTLPDDFEAPDGRFTYKPGATSYYPPIETITEDELRKMRSRSDITGRPTHAAIRPASYDATSGTRWELQLYPAADAAYQLWYVYRVKVEDLDATNKYAPGSTWMSETIIAAILALADERLRDNPRGQHYAKYQELLGRAIRRDAEDHSPQRLGPDAPQQYQYGDEYLISNASSGAVTYENP